MSETLARIHELIELNRTGDTKTTWDVDNADEVENARKVFDSLRKKNFVIYTVKKDGTTGPVMHTFDPEAERMIARPGVAGG